MTSLLAGKMQAHFTCRQVAGALSTVSIAVCFTALYKIIIRRLVFFSATL